MAQHQDTCDLTNRDSPSSTIAIVRERGEQLDSLVLGDSPLIIERHDGELVVAEDNSIEHLSPYTREAVSRAHEHATPRGTYQGKHFDDATVLRARIA